MLLDRASTVNEAVEMLKQYNMWMDDDPASYHYFMADASELSTGFTQWSEVFNLSKRTVKMSILREYDKTFEFGIE